MTPEYEYIDIDPANPPEMPLDGCLFSDDDFVLKNKSNELPRTLTEIFFGKSGKMLFEDHNGIIWKCCKLRKKKPIDFRNRWVKIKLRNEIDNTRSTPGYTGSMEKEMPENRIIYINEHSGWNSYIITREMISEILPIDYHPERKLDDTVKRLWWIEEHTTPGFRVTDYSYTEKTLLNLFPHLIQYAPGPIIPAQSEWRKV